VEQRFIRVFGARQHNLRNIDVDIPRDRLVVITGLSGSGKSSLAFDTIYAEGQRRYVESLSVHARHFLEQVGKPDVDRIEGLPPTLAIEQRAAAANPRSTVATTTEIYDFWRLLYARVGAPHCPRCGQRIFRRTVDQMVDAILAYPAATRIMLMAPLLRGRGGEFGQALRRIQREGFVRARINGELRDVKEIAELPRGRKTSVDVVVDRLVVRPDVRARLAEAVELALSLGDGTIVVSRCADESAGCRPGGGDGELGWVDEVFSERHTCTRCGTSLPELSPRAFSFNSPYGACEHCSGLGSVLRFDPQLVVPDESRSLIGGAIAPWSQGKKRVAPGYVPLLKALCAGLGVGLETPFQKLPEEARRVILFGQTPRESGQRSVEFEGVIPNLERRARSAAAENGRSRLGSFQSEAPCERCRGGRLRASSLAVRIDELNIHETSKLSIEAAHRRFEQMRFDGPAREIADPILREIRQRLRFLNDVGLGYLTLDRTSATLSGGEAQRIRLATQLGSGLVGVCYVLDEPTIGLHQRDNERLLRSIRRLADIGNTLIVVEHDEDVIRAADHLIDIGPGAGLHGGRIIAAGPPAEVLANPMSITGRYLRGEYQIDLPDQRRAVRPNAFLRLEGARQNNLKNLHVSIPLGLLVAVTGVSGSGKSTLVSQTLLPALRRALSQSGRWPQNGTQNGAATVAAVGAHDRIIGVSNIDKVIEIDQTPIGRTPRSNPATYTGVFDEIRRLYAKAKEARIRGYSGSRFSFNAKGGRCEACQGQGTRRIEMHFLPDVFVECGECKGTRYNRETLEIRYRGKSIADVLEMRVEEALRFFDSFQRLKHGLQALSDVGLGYVRLGQPSNTLSGGEAQRVKLAGELARGVLYPGTQDSPPSASAIQRAKFECHTLYVLDEPTTGLHFADIQTLLTVLNRLVEMGNTVLVIEHNLDVIKTADWIIDLGPEGGDAGGRILAEGTPEQVAACAESHTGRYLRAKLRNEDSASK
jgi:excinuclease ABC subunit A